MHRCAAQLGDAGESAEMALQLFLTAAYSASEQARSELIAYEFFEQVKLCRIIIDHSLCFLCQAAGGLATLAAGLGVSCRHSYCLRSPFQTALLNAPPWPALWGCCMAAASSPQSLAAPWCTKQQAIQQNCCARQISAEQSLPARTYTGRQASLSTLSNHLQ